MFSSDIPPNNARSYRRLPRGWRRFPVGRPPRGLSSAGFFVESGASSIALGFAGLVFLGRGYVFDIILGKLIEIGWAEFYEDTDILLDVATHLLLRILN